MKKTIRFFGIIALIAVIGFSMACGGGDEGGMDYGAQVDAPTLESKTHNSITVNPPATPSTGQAIEYAINTTGNEPAYTDWQDGTTFSGLTPSTTYYIFARSKENETYWAGSKSDALEVITDAAPVIPYNYIITKTDATFTAKRGETTVATSTAIQTVIDAIKADSTDMPFGEFVTIQFGDGDTELDIGDASISFDDDTGGKWNDDSTLIAIKGKITSTNDDDSGTIVVDCSLFIRSEADIANTGDGYAIYHEGAGDLGIYGGTVSSTGSRAILVSEAELIIGGSTIIKPSSGSSSYAVYATGASSVVDIQGGTIHGVTLVSGKLKMSGGTISTTSGVAISTTTATSEVIISGGSISTTENVAINAGGKVTISGGTITNNSATSATINITGATGELNVNGGTVKNTANGGKAINAHADAEVNISTDGGAYDKGAPYPTVTPAYVPAP